MNAKVQYLLINILVNKHVSGVLIDGKTIFSSAEAKHPLIDTK